MSVRENGTARASLELLYHVSRELAAALDLRTVLRRVLFLCMQSVHATNGSIMVLDEGGRPVESAIVIGGTLRDQVTDQFKAVYEHGLAGWVARNREAALVPSTAEDERWLRRPDDSVERTGVKSAISAPLMARDHLVGVITLVHPAPYYFQEEHLVLLKAIADQAGIAVLNARLYAESQAQARVMTAVAESAAVITASLNVEEVLQRILEQTSTALQVEAVALALLGPGSDELEFRAATGRAAGKILGRRQSAKEGVAGWVAKNGLGLIVPDAASDSRFASGFEASLGFQRQAVACAPIRLRGSVIGVLEAINPREGSWGADALLVLTGIGSLAGTAIHHAQLFERLDAAHQRYRELFEDSVDPILVTDWLGRIVEANRQAQLATGLDGSALKGKSVRELHIVDEEMGLGFMRLSSGETHSYETELWVNGSSQIPVQVHARKVDIEGVPHIQWILRDITERKKLDSMREDLLSMIYHDLRSPLANVVSSLDVLAAMQGDQGADLMPVVQIAMRSTDRIQRLTDSLLDINRLEAGQPVGERHAVDPAVLIFDACETTRTMAKHKEVDVEMEIKPGLPPILVDAEMIRRVLVNLTENAVKFTPPGSKIYVGGDSKNGFVRLWVKDSGPGIPAEEQERIFDKFTRLKPKEGPRGLGLGLAFCRLAVLGHGGGIWVESQPGQGATFFLTLPVASEMET